MDWIKREISEGLKRLMCLGLERTPAAEVIALTAAVWLEAMTTGRKWEQEHDAPRFRAGFAALCRTRESWPQPMHLLDAMPAREPLRAIEKEHRPATPEQIAAHAAALRAALGTVVEPMPAAKVERETTPEQRERIEQDLRQHYDRKTAAAGGDA